MSDDNLGPRFARAFTAKDASGMAELLHPEIDFRALTPNVQWQASGPDETLSILFTDWLEPTDDVSSLDEVETGRVSDRERVGYRFSVTNPDGDFVVEQQAYLGERDGRIDWMRVVCSGFRPA